MEISLSKKRALVCGASKGIGRAVAEEFARAGAELILLARDESELKNVAKGLHIGSGCNAHSYIVADMHKHEILKEAVSESLKKGPIEIFVHNSGGPKSGMFDEAKTEDFESAFHQHVSSAQLLAQLLTPGMRAQKYGRIINIISTSVKTPIPNLLVSNTIRAAMANWAKTLATELGPFGITVNNVLPGFTDTDRLNLLKESTAKRLNKNLKEVDEMWLSSIPARRYASPKELAYAVTFLASPMASYISGINLPVDGGRTPTL